MFGKSEKVREIGLAFAKEFYFAKHIYFYPPVRNMQGIRYSGLRNWSSKNMEIVILFIEELRGGKHNSVPGISCGNEILEWPGKKGQNHFFSSQA